MEGDRSDDFPRRSWATGTGQDVKRQPRSVTRQLERARSRVFQGDADGAAEILSSLAKRYRRDPAVWVEFSRLERLRGRTEAVEHARRAHELAPDDVLTLRELALALAEERTHMSEAIDAAERAVTADMADPASWATLASILLANDDFDAAADASRRALELDAFCVDAHLVLADAALAAGDEAESERCLRIALNLAPELEEAAEALSSLERRRSPNSDRDTTVEAVTATLGGVDGAQPARPRTNGGPAPGVADHPPTPAPGIDASAAPEDDHGHGTDRDPAAAFGPAMRGPAVGHEPAPADASKSSEPPMTDMHAAPPVSRPAREPRDGQHANGTGEHAPPAPTPDPQAGAATPTDLERMNQAVLDAVLRHIDAFNARDTAALVDGFTEDAVLRAGPERIVGHEELWEVFAGTFDGIEHAELHLRSAIVQNGSAACELTEHIDVDGDRYVSEFVGIYTVHSGRIVRARIYREDG